MATSPTSDSPPTLWTLTSNTQIVALHAGLQHGPPPPDQSGLRRRLCLRPDDEPHHRGERAQADQPRSSPRPRGWDVLLVDHHEGYISWAEFERNQRLIAGNANVRGLMVRGAVRRGDALLAGLLRCGHCGRRLHVSYSGTDGYCVRYNCGGAHINHRTRPCIAFGGLRVDAAVSTEFCGFSAPAARRPRLRRSRCGKARCRDAAAGRARPHPGALRGRPGASPVRRGRSGEPPRRRRV